MFSLFLEVDLDLRYWLQRHLNPVPAVPALNHLKPVTLLRKHVRSASFIYFHILYFSFPVGRVFPPLRVDLSE